MGLLRVILSFGLFTAVMSLECFDCTEEYCEKPKKETCEEALVCVHAIDDDKSGIIQTAACMPESFCNPNPGLISCQECKTDLCNKPYNYCFVGTSNEPEKEMCKEADLECLVHFTEDDSGKQSMNYSCARADFCDDKITDENTLLCDTCSAPYCNEKRPFPDYGDNGAEQNYISIYIFICVLSVQYLIT